MVIGAKYALWPPENQRVKRADDLDAELGESK